MSRQTFIIAFETDKGKLIEIIKKLPWNSRVEVKLPRRSLPQNDRMWAALTDISNQLLWHGQKLSTEDWKLVFMASLKREMRIVPAIDNIGFVNLGTKSSDLTKEEMMGLLTIIEAFGAANGVVFNDERNAA